MKRTISFLCALLCATGSLDAVYFRHLGMGDGLSHISVMSIYQDELGRMWFGTEEGISLYDGSSITSYRHIKDSIDIGNNNFPITGDGNGNIYFRSDRSLMHYNIRTETFRCLRSHNVRTVFCRDSTVLVAAADTVYEWNSHTETFRYILHLDAPGATINQLCIDAQRRLWIGTSRGLYMQPDGSSPAPRCIIPQEDISGLFEDSRAELWIATREQGLYRYSADRLPAQHRHDPRKPASACIPHNDVRAFAEDNRGHIWIGTFAGLSAYDPSTGLYTTSAKDDLPGSLQHSSVYAILKDRQGNIWAGTYYGGVHYFNPEADPFVHYSATSPARNDCLSHFFAGRMAEDRDGNLWICTEGGGLNRLDRRHRRFRHFLAGPATGAIAHNNLKCITYSPRHHRLYIGTHTGGLSIFDIATGRFRNLRDTRPADPDADPGDVIIRTQLAGRDTLIIHSRRGLFLMNTTTEHIRPLFDRDTLPSFTAFTVDTKGNLWLAGPAAVMRINISRPADRRIFRRPEQERFDISCIFEDRPRGRLFFGTLGHGLFLYDPACERFSAAYTADAGLLLSNYCYEIAQSADRPGELIISGDRGLSFLDVDRRTLRAIHLDALIFPGINRGNGLLVCRDGQIFAGGIGGLTSFTEADAFRENEDYDIYFSSLSVNNRRITPGDPTRILERALPFTRRITLRHDRNNILIRFSSNNYTNPHRHAAFEYRLEGLDRAWTTDDDIRYTNLRPGKYRLVVREKTAAPRTPKTIALDITVRYPWYGHPLARALYLTVACAIVYAFLRFRRTKFRLRTSLEMERLDKERIEQLNDAKLQFFSNVSHEFNTPLTLIVAQIDRLLSSGATSPFVHNKLLQISKQALYLRNLIGELLNFNRPEQERIRLCASRQNIVPFLREIHRSFRDLASYRNIAYDFNPPSEEITCSFDAKQMKKVFYNLLSNAFKYTCIGGTVELSIEETGGAVRIRVRDSGIGIDREDIDRIFDRFYRVGNASYPSGAGIGLSVVKSILDLHNGTINVESKPPYGSIFIVTLPKTGNEEATPEPLLADAAPEVSKDFKASEAPISPESDTGEEQKYTILIVEDNEELRHILQDIFRPMYRVLSAGDGKAGLEAVRQEKPDIVVSDILMPGMSGTELCTAIKNDVETCHIPVVLLTALSSAEHSIDGFRHGADDYISKPFDEKILVARCNSLIRNRAVIRSKYDRHAADTGTDLPEQPNTPSDRKFLEAVARIVDANLDNPDFNVNTLAAALNTSRSSLYAKFESLTGLTPNDFILRHKLRIAAALLRNNPELNIAETSDRAGFSSPRYFSRCFKKHYSLSPLEYRRKS